PVSHGDDPDSPRVLSVDQQVWKTAKQQLPVLLIVFRPATWIFGYALDCRLDLLLEPLARARIVVHVPGVRLPVLGRGIGVKDDLTLRHGPSGPPLSPPTRGSARPARPRSRAIFERSHAPILRRHGDRAHRRASRGAVRPDGAARSGVA